MLHKFRLATIQMTVSGAVKLTGAATATPGVVLDGVVMPVSPTITVTGALVGDPVTVGVSVPLPVGVMAYGKVTSANTVTVEIWNNSEVSVTVPTSIFTATIIH